MRTSGMSCAFVLCRFYCCFPQ